MTKIGFLSMYPDPLKIGDIVNTKKEYFFSFHFIGMGTTIPSIYRYRYVCGYYMAIEMIIMILFVSRR